MSTFSNAKRSLINAEFEAASGDMQGELEPVFVFRRSDNVNVMTADRTLEDRQMKFVYKLTDGSLSDEDVPRIVHIAYLDVLTMHYWQESTDKIQFVNADSGATVTVAYPDPE